MIKWDNMKISYQVLPHSRYIINTNFLRPALAPPCPLFITKANSHFNTSFTVMRTPLWQLLLQVSFKPSNHENKHMRQILWTNGTGGLQNLSALQKEKWLRVRSSSYPLRRPEDTEFASDWNRDKSWSSPGMGGSRILLDDSAPGKWNGLRENTGRESGPLTLGFPASAETLLPPSSAQKQQRATSLGEMECGLDYHTSQQWPEGWGPRCLPEGRWWLSLAKDLPWLHNPAAGEPQ